MLNCFRPVNDTTGISRSRPMRGCTVLITGSCWEKLRVQYHNLTFDGVQYVCLGEETSRKIEFQDWSFAWKPSTLQTEFQVLKRLTYVEGFGIGEIFILQMKKVETVQHKTVEYLLVMNETKDSLMSGSFGTLEKRDSMGQFDVWIELFILFILSRALLIVPDDVRQVRSGQTSRMSQQL